MRGAAENESSRSNLLGSFGPRFGRLSLDRACGRADHVQKDLDLLRRDASILEDPDELAARQVRATSPKPGRKNAQSGHRSGSRAFVDGEREPPLDAQRDGTALALEGPSC